MQTSVGRLKAVLLGTALAAAVTLASVQPADAQRTTLRWATSDVGSYGYSVGSLISEVLQQNLGDDYAVVVQPFPSTTAAMKATMNGEAEFSYTADVGMRGLYDNEPPYEGFEPTAGTLVHTLYVYPMETFLVVPTAAADQYDSWGDFDGEPMFFTPAGYMNWLNMRRIWDALGYEFNHVEIDSATTADALEAGSVIGAASYTTAGASLPTWWREAELRADITAINPTEEEMETLRAAGLSPMEIDPSVAFSQEVGVDTIWGVPIYFAYNVRADMDAELVQQILNILNDNVEGLAEGDPGFKPLARDFVGTQAAGVAANPDIPVHPGLAAFLQEHGQWDASWQVADGM
jgi:uncharacterized protein